MTLKEYIESALNHVNTWTEKNFDYDELCYEGGSIEFYEEVGSHEIDVDVDVDDVAVRIWDEESDDVTSRYPHVVSIIKSALADAIKIAEAGLIEANNRGIETMRCLGGSTKYRKVV